MVVTVDGARGPLTVTSQNTAGISYPTGSSQTVTWAVNNTNLITGGANVDILITTDNGVTWTPLLTNTPNDGTQAVTMPASPAPFCRLMVKANGNIFLNVNSTDFAVGYTVTTTCNTYSNDTPLAIPDGVGSNASGGNVSKTVVVSGLTNNISDVNVTISSAHTYFWDLNAFVTHPDATVVNLLARNCNNSSPGGFDIKFDDAAGAIACADPVIGTYAPSGSLATLNGKTGNGTWTITANDNWNGDTGSIVKFQVEICTQQAVLASENFGIEGFSLYPNPNNGTFNIQFTSTSSNEVKVNVHDMRGREIYNKSFQNSGLFNESLQLNNVQSGVYLVTVQDGARKEVKKIIVE